MVTEDMSHKGGVFVCVLLLYIPDSQNNAYSIVGAQKNALWIK